MAWLCEFTNEWHSRGMADQAARADGDAALVLEPAAGVDKDAFAHGDVPAEIGVEGREQCEGAVHRLTGDL